MMAGDVSNAASPPPQPRRKTSGLVVPHRARWYQRLAAGLIWLTSRLVGATLRFQLEDRSGHFSGVPQEPMIFAIWHNRLALSMILLDRYVRRHDPARSCAALVSASKDGGLLAHVLELFKVEPVRGSSSRRGPQALRELVSWGERGYDLAITPDGPRGPCYQVQEGVISTAQLTGLMIVPATYHLNWKIQLKSWDRFQIPLPFARCEVTTGRGLRVPREATAAEREQLRQQLETELRAITRD
jgi:lysophospholipid acyltransferase (LPLAT)-like uncharacterized protein